MPFLALYIEHSVFSDESKGKGVAEFTLPRLSSRGFSTSYLSERMELDSLSTPSDLRLFGSSVSRV